MLPPPRLGAEPATFVLKGLEVEGDTAFAAEDFKRAAAITARRTGSPALSVSGGGRSVFFKHAGGHPHPASERFFSLQIGLTGQWAGSALLSAEQFVLGGSQYGRGSDPAEINPGESTCRRGLASAGLGVRSDLTDQLALTAELAKPGERDRQGHSGISGLGGPLLAAPSRGGSHHDPHASQDLP